MTSRPKDGGGQGFRRQYYSLCHEKCDDGEEDGLNCVTSFAEDP